VTARLDDPPFDRVLIANRGEVAVRIVNTLERLGVESVVVFSEVDRDSPAVDRATEAVLIGEGPSEFSYLWAERIVEVAMATGAQAVHPGYGFLSERPEFAEDVEAAGLQFIGPTPDQIRRFGRKHTARRLARDAGVALLPGSELIHDGPSGSEAAAQIGFPVVVKSSAGGGGIGMEVCRSPAELPAALERVRRAALSNFGSSEVYIEHFVEHARHIEVQIFGDGCGDVVVLGDRECSAQRRNQKVLEEAPAPNLPERTRNQLAAWAGALAESVSYRSAGTVEFVVDARTHQAYFLEVNTRLQVEHGVTEETCGIDLVEWMVRGASGDHTPMRWYQHEPAGHAIEARVYAERPDRDFLPSAGLLTRVAFAAEARVDTWVRTGTEVSPFYDPLLAKLIVTGGDRASAVARLQSALAESAVDGIATNLEFLEAFAHDEVFVRGEVTTATLEATRYESSTVEVLEAGNFTTVQDHPGRLGYWHVGVPPSGPMDDRSFRIGNAVVGNPPSAAGLECTVIGPTLCFHRDATVCVAGAPMTASLDGDDLPLWTAVRVPAGGLLELGAIDGPGCRTYLLVTGGIDVPPYLGSRATFTLGRFGGHGGRRLRAGDMLPLGADTGAVVSTEMSLSIPDLVTEWEIGVVSGPHGAPDYFTDEDIDALYASPWEVHYNSSRTGVRLVGPRPQWARPDGGEAGLHPSNIHDNAYAIGTIDFTGDMPIVLGPDGPSLGGFVCPATVVASERWKLGQLSPGDTVRFVRTDSRPGTRATPAVLARRTVAADRPEATYRRAGDENLLIEYGPDVLDFDLRFRIHALSEWIVDQQVDGVVDLTPGIRSLQVHVDRRQLDVAGALELVRRAEDELPGLDDLEVPSRIVRLPLSWDDPTTIEATDRYVQSVRADAPWCPHNLEFIRRINGLATIDDVRQTVFDASYLVLGLGDVYLGAPVATPVDPRHRLVTTKYNPARTWTPENAVGIGGAYLCVYGMEGPGGYQFVGRTIPVWNRWRVTRHFEKGRPWLLRCFDQIRWFEVSADELLEWRRDLLLDRVSLDVQETTFSLAEHHRFLEDHAVDIAATKSRQQAAFDEERRRWEASGEFEAAERAAAVPVDADRTPDVEVPPADGGMAIRAPTGASVWRIDVRAGSEVCSGDPLLVLEAMKMESVVESPLSGMVEEVRCTEGQVVSAGQILLVLREASTA
jgi:urea carboxylase